MKYKFVFLCLIISAGCTNLPDATPTERTAFARFFERDSDFQGVSALPTSDGFVVACNLTQGLGASISILKTDNNGNVIWETIIPNAEASALLPLDDGYLLFGDSIEVNEEATRVVDQVRTKLRLIQIGSNGNITIDKTLKKIMSDTSVNFTADALTIDAGGEIIGIGSFQTFGSNKRTIIVGYDPGTLDTVWTRAYGLINRDYRNSRSAHINSLGNIIWASSVALDQQTVTSAYLTIPVIEPGSTFVNSSFFGEGAGQFFSGADIDKGTIGYGVIGTYSNPDHKNANIYFVRVDPTGTVIPGTERYFDGVSIENDNSPLPDRNQSASQDAGLAISSTLDGGFILAGTMTTTPERGNGGDDILLIRIDPFGNPIWNTLLGGSGNDTPNSIKATSDGGFLICGTSEVNGLSSAFMVKTNSLGEITE